MGRVVGGLVVVIGALWSGAPTWADVYVLKSGGVVEGKTVRVYPKKIPGQGAPKNCYVVKKEDGKEEEISEKDIAYIVPEKKTSWEVRAENKAQYEKDVLAVKDDWKSQEAFAKKLRGKRFLDAEAEKHFKKAYELRKPEIKDDIESHTTVAKLLETDWQLYEEAKTEWRWVYARRREICTTPEMHVTLAKWCVDEGLYDEAAESYEEALKLNARHDGATRGKRYLANAPKVNSQFYRALFERLNRMVGLLESKRKPDGSYGSDITEAAVHGHHAMTALAGLSLLAKWDFQAIKNPSSIDACPATVKAILPWVCLNDKRTMDEKESKDIWGPIWRLEFLAQCYRHAAIGETMKKAIVKRVEQTLNELRGLVRADGGWAYYEFVQEGITFVTACAIVAMVDAKEAGLPYDDTMISKACDSVASARQSAGLYGYHHRGAEDEVGCAGRSPLCEYALIRAGKGDPAALATGVENFFKHRHLLEAIKDKEGTHIGKGQTAPYYYLFGHYWTSRALHLLPKDKQTEYYKKMRDILARNMKPNGELTDTPLTKDNEVYGTAFGALWAYQIAIEEWKEKRDEDAEPAKEPEKR